MIVEQEKQLQDIQDALNKGDSLWIPMYSDPFSHYTNNSISFIYIFSISENKYFIIPFRHKDCYNQNIEILNNVQLNVMMQIWWHGGKIIKCCH